MYSLDSLMNRTPGDVVDRSRYVTASVRSVKNAKKRDLDTLQFVVRCQGRTDKDPKRTRPIETYDVVIEFYPTELKKDIFAMPSVKAPVWVYCSCPYFFYYNMYALARVGSSEITNEHNGARAWIRNPENSAYLCKHLYRAAPACVEHAKKNASSQAGKYQFKS